MEAYIINLDKRTDRWENCLRELKKVNISATRVSALTPSKVENEKELFATRDIIAIWISHKKAMQAFLNSGASHALILEDDFSFRLKNIEKINDLFVKFNLDFLQIGFLLPHISDYCVYRIENLQDFFLKLLSHFKLKSFAKKHSITEQKNVPISLVLNGIRAGGHAYVINRRFAETCLLINSPTFLSTDGLFISLGIARNFKMARLRKSKVSQTNSPSSVVKRIKD